MRPTWVETTEQNSTEAVRDAAALGRSFGERSATEAIEWARTFGHWEKLRIQKTNAGEIAKRQARLELHCQRRDELTAFLQRRPPVDLVALGRKRQMYLLLSTVFAVASIVFAHMAMAPLGLGWEAWVVGVAVGLMGMILCAKFIEAWESHTSNFMRGLITVAFFLWLAAALVMGFMRAGVFGYQLTVALAGTGGASGADATSDLVNRFYRDAKSKLEVLLPLLAVAMELATGITLREFWNLALAPERGFEKAEKERLLLEPKMPEEVSVIRNLESQPENEEAKFMQGVLQGHLDGLSKLKTLVCAGFVALLTVAWSGLPASAQDFTVLIGLDLTRSVAARGYDGRSEYDRNVEGARVLVSHLPAGTRITAVAITDRSFSNPLLLFSGQAAREHGPLQFLDQRVVSRIRFAEELRQRCQSLQPKFDQTDIVGFLFLAAQSLGPVSGKKVVVIFSDMRESTKILDLERGVQTEPDEMLRDLMAKNLVPDLQGVDVYIYGVDAALRGHPKAANEGHLKTGQRE
jgi:hypothetical protein